MERATKIAMLWMFSAAYSVYKSFFFIQSGVCRYQPSCSEYARKALYALPPHRAIAAILRRVISCHPLSRGGYDPAPNTRD